MHTRLKIPVWRRNLAQRPAAPALGNGRVQRLAQRALLVLGGKATTSQVIEWACCRKRLLHGRRIERTTPPRSSCARTSCGPCRAGKLARSAVDLEAAK